MVVKLFVISGFIPVTSETILEAHWIPAPIACGAYCTHGSSEARLKPIFVARPTGVACVARPVALAPN